METQQEQPETQAIKGSFVWNSRTFHTYTNGKIYRRETRYISVTPDREGSFTRSGGKSIQVTYSRQDGISESSGRGLDFARAAIASLGFQESEEDFGTYRVQKVELTPVGYYDDEREEWIEVSSGKTVYEIVYVDPNGNERAIDGRSCYDTKQAAYRRCAQLNQRQGGKGE